MSLLTICQNVADEVGVDQPSTIIGNADENAIRLLAAAKREGKRLSRRHDWAILQIEHEFNTAASDDEYQFPADFDRMLGDTAWDRNNYWALRGPLSPAQWQIRKSALVASSLIRKRWRIRQDPLTMPPIKAFFVDPVPTAVETLVFDYVSSSWVADATTNLPISDWSADNDTALIDEELIELGVLWRFRKMLGLVYLDERDEYERAVERAAASDSGLGTINMAGDRPAIAEVNVPEGDFG